MYGNVVSNVGKVKLSFVTCFIKVCPKQTYMYGSNSSIHKDGIITVLKIALHIQIVYQVSNPLLNREQDWCKQKFQKMPLPVENKRVLTFVHCIFTILSICDLKDSLLKSIINSCLTILRNKK